VLDGGLCAVEASLFSSPRRRERSRQRGDQTGFGAVDFTTNDISGEDLAIKSLD
jgi:hypothetical protein